MTRIIKDQEKYMQLTKSYTLCIVQVKFPSQNENIKFLFSHIRYYDIVKGMYTESTNLDFF